MNPTCARRPAAPRAVAFGALFGAALFGPPASGVTRAAAQSAAPARVSGGRVSGARVDVGALAGAPDARVRAVRRAGGWAIAVDGAGAASVVAERPVRLEFYRDGAPRRAAAAYDAVRREGGVLVGSATAEGPGGARLLVRDAWRTEGAVLRLRRTVTVRGSAPGGFMSGVTFAAPGRHARADVALFAPGMIYGGTAHLTDSAIGGARTYREGAGEVWVREDRLPAPLFGVRFADGSSLAVLDPAPNAATTRADAEDTAAVPLVDSAFRFAALGAHVAPRGADSGRVETGAWYPGTEGEVTYAGNAYPGGQLRRWRRRYHPLADGFVQRYALDVRVGREADAPAFERAAWRWAWGTLRPAVHLQELAAARRSIVDLLAGLVEVHGDTGRGGDARARADTARAGVLHWIPANAGDRQRGDSRALLGFTGKNLEAAEFLLAEGARDTTARGARLRALGARVFDSFARLGMAPPAGEGFDLDTGAPVTDLGWPGDPRVYLRSLTDDMKATVRAVRRERALGARGDRREDPRAGTWLAWARTFADWLVAQQRPDGSFPRAWRPGTGAVFDTSSLSSYAPVPFLVFLSEVSGDPRYLAAARRAGEFAWRTRPAGGAFVGGTVDNPDVIDKEAGTLSVEAYLALYEATRERAWLEHARAAADYAETWIYLWDVPMPAGEPGAAIGWKPGVPTTGAQLIATGHSLVDEYMAFDVDSYARLARYTGDAHYLDVARLLLHDTKVMLALPGRPYDLKGPGWQQEHWSFAPRRGNGLHRGWLPWVATSQLKGMIALEEFDPALYRSLAGP